MIEQTLERIATALERLVALQGPQPDSKTDSTPIHTSDYDDAITAYNDAIIKAALDTLKPEHNKARKKLKAAYYKLKYSDMSNIDISVKR